MTGKEFDARLNQPFKEPLKVVKRTPGLFLKQLDKEIVADVSVVMPGIAALETIMARSLSDMQARIKEILVANNDEKLIAYLMKIIKVAGRTQLCAAQRDQMAENNLKIMTEKNPYIKF